MGLVKTEIVNTFLHPKGGYLAVTKDATTGVMAAVDGVLYEDQADARAAIDTAAALAVATTRYVILRVYALAGTLATVS
jgi:hypothetical protein